jgi:protein-tyrosine phosphatase
MPLSAITRPANFRDLAAHVPPRHALRRHTLFRSDHLGALNADDARQIQALGIRRVLDFRGVDERTSAACTLPDVAVHSLAIEPTIVQKLSGLLAGGAQLTEDDVVAMMQDTYRGFVRTSTARFAEFFQHLLESNEPTVFHCTAGKDRTGFAAALVLRALDVPEDIVMHDYLHTNDRLRPPADAYFPPAVARVLYRVQPEFLQASFAAIEQDYGSLEGYLREGLGLRDAQRARLLALYRTQAPA